MNNAKYKIDYDPMQNPNRQYITYMGEQYKLASLEDGKTYYVIMDDQGNETYVSEIGPSFSPYNPGSHGTIVAEGQTPEIKS